MDSIRKNDLKRYIVAAFLFLIILVPACIAVINHMHADKPAGSGGSSVIRNENARQGSVESTSAHNGNDVLVVIDPGHGGIDPGAGKSDLLEKDVCLDIALKLEKELDGMKIPTFLTRKGDEFIEAKDRIIMANQKHATLFLSIHSNSFTEPQYGGVMTLYYPSDTIKTGKLTESMYASIIQAELAGSLGMNDRGMSERPGLAVLRHAEMPSVITEIGFLSNEGDSKLLGSADFRQKAAESLAHGIKKALDEMS